MGSRNINVLFTSFSGLGLPRTLNLIRPENTSINDLLDQVEETLPPLTTRLVVTTNRNRPVKRGNTELSALLLDGTTNFVQLRISVPLCGGKGGFGSQLRAAGGRMSSKRKKAQGENNGSNRNLDGRRLRTVNEAKALAEYLALKPEMVKKDKEERKKRWEQIIDIVERREEELRNGSKGKVDGKWVEDKEEAGERTREAVLIAMQSGLYNDNLRDITSTVPAQVPKRNLEGSRTNERGLAFPMLSTPVAKPIVAPSRSYAGFDDDEDFMSESNDGNESGADIEGRENGRMKAIPKDSEMRV